MIPPDLLCSRTPLDYGSGKGKQYLPSEFRAEDGTTHPDLQSYWGVESVKCYDPGYEKLSTLPQGTFDGVISTDVIEHCPEEDLDRILEEFLSYARNFVFANIACYPANKALPNGENEHCTVRPVAWWQKKITEVASRHPGIHYRFNFELRDDPPSPRGIVPRLLARVRKRKPVERLVLFEA